MVTPTVPSGLRKLAAYRNGNTHILLFEDGTKIRMTPDDEFRPDFPESIDLKLTNFCKSACAFCHEGATSEGSHANLEAAFLKTLTPGVELALGGGAVTTHPGLDDFLQRLQGQGCIANITVHAQELLEHRSRIERLIEKRLVWGVGVSMQAPDDRVMAFASRHSNCVIHLINGVADERLFIPLVDRGLKILILGYKHLRRGIGFRDQRANEIAANQAWLGKNLESLMGRFRVVSFDNLALEQLCIQERVSSEDWDSYFMGSDGSHTMYIDLVQREFAVSSTAERRFPITDDIRDMFRTVREAASALD